MRRLTAIALAMLVVTVATASPTDIHEAVKAGNVAAVTALLDNTPALVGARDPSGATPLHAAARGTVPAMLALLVARGADLDAVDQAGTAALHILASRGDVSGLALLLDKGAGRWRRCGCWPAGKLISSIATGTGARRSCTRPGRCAARRWSAPSSIWAHASTRRTPPATRP
jgi:hypothetical protein